MANSKITSPLRYQNLDGKTILIYGGSYSDETSASTRGMQPNWVQWMRASLRNSTIINRAHAGDAITGYNVLNPAVTNIYKTIANETNTYVDGEGHTVTFDPDIIILFGGTNDYRFRRELGEYSTSNDTFRFCGALYKIAQRFAQIGPHARVFVITLPKVKSDYATSDHDWQESTPGHPVYYSNGDVVRYNYAEHGATPIWKYYRNTYIKTDESDPGMLSTDANSPASDSTYWEWIDITLRPPVAYRNALATWAGMNGYNLIDGYDFPLLNPYNDPYGYCAGDGIHYTASYAPILAEYLMNKMNSGGDTALVNDTTRIEFLEWANRAIQEWCAAQDPPITPISEGGTGGYPTITSAVAYLSSDGDVELLLGGNIDVATQGTAYTLAILPEHLRPQFAGTGSFLMWYENYVDGVASFYAQYCTIQGRSSVDPSGPLEEGKYVVSQRAPATGTGYFNFRAYYNTRFGGYNRNPA